MSKETRGMGLIGMRAMPVVIAGTLLGSLVAPQGVAYAKTEEEVRSEMQLAEESIDAATGDIERLQTEISDANARVEALQATLPGKRDEAASTMRSLYKMYSDLPAEVAIILGTENADVMMNELFLYESISTTNIKSTIDMSQELAAMQESIATKGSELEQAQERLASSQEELTASEAILERILNAPPAIEGCEPIDWSMTDEEIVAEWAPRIDAYLEGHALEGHGEDFVRAGIKYGVDPRFSVAISNTESTRGDFCFTPHNAWGYMVARYSTWEEGIYDHTKYLSSSLYNGKLNAQTAQIYCPPTWQSWLSNTLSAAQSI